MYHKIKIYSFVITIIALISFILEKNDHFTQELKNDELYIFKGISNNTQKIEIDFPNAIKKEPLILVKTFKMWMIETLNNIQAQTDTVHDFLKIIENIKILKEIEIVNNDNYHLFFPKQKTLKITLLNNKNLETNIKIGIENISKNKVYLSLDNRKNIFLINKIYKKILTSSILNSYTNPLTKIKQQDIDKIIITKNSNGTLIKKEITHKNKIKKIIQDLHKAPIMSIKKQIESTLIKNHIISFITNNREYEAEFIISKHHSFVVFKESNIIVEVDYLFSDNFLKKILNSIS